MKWLKSFLEHPKTSLAGLGALIGAGTMVYGMSTGEVPIDVQSITTAGGLASAGLAGLSGKDAVNSADKKSDTTVSFVTQYQALQAASDEAAQNLARFQATVEAATAAARALKIETNVH